MKKQVLKFYFTLMAIMTASVLTTSCNSEEDFQLSGKTLATRMTRGSSEYIASGSTSFKAELKTPPNSYIEVSIQWNEGTFDHYPEIIKPKTGVDDIQPTKQHFGVLMIDNIEYQDVEVDRIECDYSQCQFSFSNIDPSSGAAVISFIIPYTVYLTREIEKESSSNDTITTIKEKEEFHVNTTYSNHYHTNIQIRR